MRHFNTDARNKQKNVGIDFSFEHLQSFWHKIFSVKKKFFFYFRLCRSRYSSHKHCHSNTHFYAYSFTEWQSNQEYTVHMHTHVYVMIPFFWMCMCTYMCIGMFVKLETKNYLIRKKAAKLIGMSTNIESKWEKIKQIVWNIRVQTIKAIILYISAPTLVAD